MRSSAVLVAVVCLLAVPAMAAAAKPRAAEPRIYQALYEHGAELVLTSHAHNYERFEPMDASGTADGVHGVTQFVVATGGRSLFRNPGP